MDTLDERFQRLTSALKSLPDDERADVLAELEARLAARHTSQLSDAQRSVVTQRLAAPRSYASDAEVNAVLAKFRRAS